MQEALPLSANANRPRTQGKLILLTLLVIFPFLALLVFEQGRVIDNQRVLIQQLVGDSLELNAIKARDARNRSAAPNAMTPQTPQAPQAKSDQAQPGAASKAPKRNRTPETREAPAHQAPPRVQPQPRRVIDMSRLKAV